MRKMYHKLILLCNVLLVIVLLPVIVAEGFATEYMADNNVIFVRLLSNQALYAIAFAGGIMSIFLMGKYTKKRMTCKGNIAANIVLTVLFVALYVLNFVVAKEIAFKIGWDIGVVRETAYHIAREDMLGYQFYYSMYQNNIPIAYILGRILRFAQKWIEDPCMAELVWINVNCALISIAGFFCCILVKKLTRQLVPTIVALFFYLALVGISPWKIAPYTDTYAIVFPVMCIYFYFCYRDAKNSFYKYVFLIFSLFAGMMGGYIKASVYLAVIAVLGLELIRFCAESSECWKYTLTGVLMTVVMVYAGGKCTNHIIEEIGLDYNKEVEGSWHHYFYMGLNEETLGGYSQGAVAVFGEFQTSKSDRNKAELERAAALMKDRGIGGNLYFWLKKMVKTFNDGTFGWRQEGGIAEYYPDYIASNTDWTEKLRHIFWFDKYEGDVYQTFAHGMWILCVFGILRICLCRREKRERYAILIISFLGIFFYQMLLEARARYLFVFLPLLIAISVCGMQQYVAGTEIFWSKCRERLIRLPSTMAMRKKG